MARPKRPGAKPRSMWTTEEEYKELMDHLRDMRDGEELNDNEKLGLLVKHASSLTRSKTRDVACFEEQINKLSQENAEIKTMLQKILEYCKGED